MSLAIWSIDILIGEIPRCIHHSAKKGPVASIKQVSYQSLSPILATLFSTVSCLSSQIISRYQTLFAKYSRVLYGHTHVLQLFVYVILSSLTVP